MCTHNVSKCLQCGNSFPETSKPKKYCTKECYWSAMRDGKHNRGSSIERRCHYCKEIFRGRPEKKLRNGRVCEKIFCSRSCYDKSRSDHIESTKKACKNCGSEITSGDRSRRKFCSISCRNEFKRPLPVNCINCGTFFTAMKAMRRPDKIEFVAVSGAKTCSKECQIAWISNNADRKEKISKSFVGDRHPNWQGGSHYGGSRGSGWGVIADRCREIHGHQCKSCGMSQEESISKGWGRLQVNHITPFHQHKNKTHANRQSNLEALCKSCHTRIDWQWRKENPIQYLLNIFR